MKVLAGHRAGLTTIILPKRDERDLEADIGIPRKRQTHEGEQARNADGDTGQFEKPEYVFGSCGAAVLYRRRMLEDCAISEFEYFDNEYNMFYEDMDLSWRAANLKWKAYYEPAAIAYHMRGATSKEKKPLFSFIRAYNFAWLRSELKAEVIRNRYMTIRCFPTV